MALDAAARPTRATTVFAGQDPAATQRAREYFTGYAPSSPAIALLKDGELVFMLERWQIEGRSAQAIAQDLAGALDEHAGGQPGTGTSSAGEAPAAGRSSLPIA
jgi:putative YphP/YqiW family bacilliredoxin